MKEQEVNEINFADLKREDKLIVETEGKYEITIIGIRKDGLRVKVKEESGNEVEEYTARMTGGFTKFGVGITPGIIKIRSENEENCLYLENPKDIKTRERLSKSIRTTPIERIILIKKDESQQKS